MRLGVRNSGETPQQNEQPDSVDQSAHIVSNTRRRPASFIKRVASFTLALSMRDDFTEKRVGILDTCLTVLW